MTLSSYVRDADGQSAMADNQCQAFKRREPKGLGQLGRNAYWLPNLEAR